MPTRLEIDQKIAERFAYLARVLEPDQDRERFEQTKTLLTQVFAELLFDRYPDIGVNDAGQTIAEWHNYADYTIISVVPLASDKILFECMKKNRTLLTVATTLDNLKKNHNRELALGLTENYEIGA